jgi:hypothetical protein
VGSGSVSSRLFPCAVYAAGIFAAATAAIAQPACPPQGHAFERLTASDTEIAYRWEPSPLKVGQFFSAEIVACRSPAPITRIALDAAMPAHGHGMNYRPKVTEIAPGHYRFTGLMLHMPGRWQITVDLYDGTNLTRRLTHTLDLRP